MNNRELDVLVAEKVMKQEVLRGEGQYECGHISDDYILDGRSWTTERNGVLVGDLVPYYSTSIKDAWKVVDRMVEKGWTVQIDAQPSIGCQVIVVEPGVYLADGRAENAPRAICLAALDAFEIEVVQ